MAEEKTIIMTPEGGSTPSYPAFAGLGNGFGSFNSIADLFGLAIIASMFGWGNGGWGGFGGGFGNAGGAGFLSNQLNNDSGRELLMNAINSNGEATRSAVQNLASALGQDFNLVNAGVQNVQNALATLSAQTGMSSLQIINAIQSGNAALASQLQNCCCENRLATCQQTNTLSTAITGASQRNTDAIADLKTSMVAEFCALKERELQSKIDTQGDIITQLRGQLDNDRQTAQLTAMISPLYAQLNAIAAKQPNTVPVVWPNLTATEVTPTTPTNG